MAFIVPFLPYLIPAAVSGAAAIQQGRQQGKQQEEVARVAEVNARSTRQGAAALCKEAWKALP